MSLSLIFEACLVLTDGSVLTGSEEGRICQKAEAILLGMNIYHELYEVHIQT